MDPTVIGITHSNLQREKCFFINIYLLDQLLLRFFFTPVNNFRNVLFQVLSIDWLGAIFHELLLLKVQRRAEALFKLI